MHLVIIKRLDIAKSKSKTYSCTLQEKNGKREFNVIIGEFEALGIALAIESNIKVEQSRPLTHELFANTLDWFDIKIKNVLINKLIDGIFHARLSCVLGDKVIEIDSRTSDAIALAARVGCDIYVTSEILDKVGIINGAKPSVGEFANMSIAEMNDEMGKATIVEDYKKAIRLRDEINNRK